MSAGAEGKIVINLGLDGEEVVDVDVDNQRQLHISNILKGKSPTQAAAMVPLLYSLCGTAQSCAAVTAIEDALNLASPAEAVARRHALVAMESLREHLWRILLDWPALISTVAENYSMQQVVTLGNDYRQALTGAGNLFVPGPTTLNAIEVTPDPELLADLLSSLEELLTRQVFGLSPDKWLALETPDQMAAWAATSPLIAARFIHRLLTKGWAEIGDCPIRILPALRREQALELTASDAAIAAPRLPTQDEGQWWESTSLTRCHTPLLAAVKQRHGHGLLSRTLARLIDIALQYQTITAFRPGDQHRQATHPQGTGPGDADTRIGIGQVEAARGRLIHRVVVESGKVCEYRVLAPTEWHFQPGGIIARSLATLCGRADEITSQAHLLITAIDPCVGYDLGIDVVNGRGVRAHA